MEISGLEPEDPRPALPLSSRLRDGTAELHRRAERTGIVRAILRGEVDRARYALLLRNLLPVYETMEGALARRSRRPGLPFAHPALPRTARIEADLVAIGGPDAGRALPLLPSARAYVARVAAVAAAPGHRLLAHAYTRYLGDLSGGQILARLLAKRPGLTPDMLRFYAFPGLGSPDAHAERCRLDLDGLELGPAEASLLVEEAATAFSLNIALSLETAAAPSPPLP